MNLSRTFLSFPAGLLCFVALVAALAPLYCIVTYGVDVPFWDQWWLAVQLDKAYGRTLTFGDLWEQHNVHRIFFPRLIMIGLAKLTAWNVKWEMAISFTLSVILFWFICRLALKVADEIWHGRMKWILIPILASIVFSLSQWANYTWGWQIQIFLSIGAVVAGFELLSRCSMNTSAFTLALVLGVVASYSFGTGLVYWPVGFWLLGGRSDWPHRSRVVHRLIWVTIAALTIYFYTHDFEEPSRRELQIVSWAQWLDYVRYTLAYLGSPIVLFAPAATPWAGVIGLVGFGGLFAAVSRSKSRPERALRSTVGLGSYAVGCGLLTGIGRVSHGIDQALSSRYVTFGMLFWIAFLLMTVMALNSETNGGTVHSKHATKARIIQVAAILLLVGLVQISSAHEVPHMLSRHRKLKSAGAELYWTRNEGALRYLFPNTETLKQRFLPALRRWNLSVWRETKGTRQQSDANTARMKREAGITAIESPQRRFAGGATWKHGDG